MNKYFNDAVIGNNKIRAGLTKKGEIIRLFYPNIDFKQFIEEFKVGVKVNDSNLIHLEDDINNVYDQHYSIGTNVLNTEIENTYFNLNVIQTDCAPIENDNLLIRKYTITNLNTIPLDIKLVIKSKLMTNNNNEVGSRIIDNGLVQYTHDYNFAIFSNRDILTHKLHGIDEVVESGMFEDKDYIGMTNNAGIIYDLKEIKPNEKVEIPIYIYVNDNSDKYRLPDIEKEFDKIVKQDYDQQIAKTKKYWRKYLKNHSNIEFEDNIYENRIKNIYDRTILLYPLLTNLEFGGIAAAMEVDEKKSKCGRYAYTWPRDAVFITKAFDLLKMTKETEKFYKNFCKNTQSKNGMWEQRFFTDGRLAPSWGYQIDETASVIYGVYEHYLYTKEFKFLKDNFKMIEKATKYLIKYIDKIINGEQPEKISYDLWEMHEGISLYSLASIFASFEVMIKANELMLPEFTNNRLKQNELKNQNIGIRKIDATLTVHHYIDGTTTKLADDQVSTVYYGDTYTTDIHKDITDNYELKSKTNNFTGTVNSNTIEVIYYYQKKDSSLETTITKNGPKEITKKNEVSEYKITYTAKVKDYIGNGTITIIDTLPYHLNKELSDLNGGIYNEETNTITWTIPWNGIDSFNNKGEITIEKNISLIYSDLLPTERIMVNSVKGTIILDNNSREIESQTSTNIKIPGTIIVHHYLKNTKIEITPDEIFTKLVGEELITSEFKKEGYIIYKPETEIYTFTEETQEVTYEYEKIKFHITTLVDGTGGKITGDEDVEYGNDSTKDKIIIKPDEGYVLSSVIINGEKLELSEKDKYGLVLENFHEMKEDMNIVVKFEKVEENPNTGSFINYIVLISVPLSLGIFKFIKNKKKLIKL